MKKGKKWYNSITNWLLIIGCIILIPILVINLFIIIESHNNPNEIPSVFGYKPFIVLSGSMETEIHKGDLILTKSVEPENLVVGDVIAFRDADNTITTHRIIELVKKDGVTYFVTKGDNNTTQDTNMVEYNDVEGIYVSRIPAVGSIMNSLSSTTTFIVLLVVITIAFVIGFTINSKKQLEVDKKEFLEYKRMKEEEAKKSKKDLD